jgi:V8-like Glu-specific endopeptidase
VWRAASLVLAAAFLTAAAGCGGGGSPSPRTAEPSAPVVHTLAYRTDDAAVFKAAPALAPGAPPTGTSSGGVLTAQGFAGVPEVGALFIDAGDSIGIHYCTASVVSSAGGDMIVTAAHCVYGNGFGGFQNHLLFVPGFHDDSAPYGAWVATSAVVDRRWIDAADEDADVAFLTVRRVGSGSGTLESVTGGHKLRTDPEKTERVDVVAYPLGAEQPVSCSAPMTAYVATQLRFDCGGLPDGSSGAPFLAGDGAVVGVVGGYQQGGLTPEISYSSYFGADVARLYQAAVGAG